MQLTYKDKDYDVVIEKKKGQKNTYIRVKKDLKVTVTTGYFTSIRFIEKLIEDNYNRIGKMIDFQETKARNNRGFFYLGNQYIEIIREGKEMIFEDNKVYHSFPHISIAFCF